jgi:hypothetical protein
MANRYDLCLLVTTLVSVGHCIVCPIYIEVGQTIQWPTDTNVVIRRYTLK